MTPELCDRLGNLGCHIEELVIFPLMEDSDVTADFLCGEVWEFIPKLLNLTQEQQEMYDETDEDPIGFLNNLGISGIFFSINGRIFRQLEGSSMRIATFAVAVEFGYAESYDKLEAAINDVLDRIEPRLVENE